MTVSPKTIFVIPVGINRYTHVLRLDSVVRSRLNKMLGGEKYHLGWEYGKTDTTLHLYTDSERYTTEMESALAYHMHRFLAVAPTIIHTTAPKAKVLPKPVLGGIGKAPKAPRTLATVPRSVSRRLVSSASASSAYATPTSAAATSTTPAVYPSFGIAPA